MGKVSRRWGSEEWPKYRLMVVEVGGSSEMLEVAGYEAKIRVRGLVVGGGDGELCGGA